MQTKTYTELFALIQALCGVVFASIETPRIKALINRRALRAYRATNYWPRFLKIGEERRLSGDSAAATGADGSALHGTDPAGSARTSQRGFRA